MPYGLDHLQKARDQGRVLLVHHVTDALALRRIGLAALALLDAHSSLDQLTARLRGISAIYLLATESEGVAISQWIARSGLASTIQTFAKPGGASDLTDVYREGPDRFLDTINQALAEAIPWEASERARRAAKKEHAWTLCEPLARHERILDVFAEDLRHYGFAGDPSLAQTLFLSLTSRLLDLPVSVALKGPSAGGKSYLLSSVLAFFPGLAYYMMSTLSPKALAYLREPLTHQMLVVAEYDGMEDKRTEYLLRTLLSEGRITYAVPVNVGGRWVTRQIVIEGPTGLILTTTRLKLHAENETRMLSVEINDTAHQTRAILRAEAEGARGEESLPLSGLASWRALQEWLQSGEHDVIVPYADRIAEQMSTYQVVRLRRDFPRVLQMIKAHALLHQINRDRDTANRIVASREDYTAIYRLMAPHLAVDVEATVSPEIRETVQAVGRLSVGDEKSTVSLTILARELGLDKSSVSRRVGHAIQAGFLRNRETRQGLPARLVPGEALPGTETLVLPLPDQLWPDG